MTAVMVGIVTYPILARVDRCRSARRAEPATTDGGGGPRAANGLLLGRLGGGFVVGRHDDPGRQEQE